MTEGDQVRIVKGLSCYPMPPPWSGQYPEYYSFAFSALVDEANQRSTSLVTSSFASTKTQCPLSRSATTERFFTSIGMRST